MLVALAIFSSLLTVTLMAFDQGLNSWTRSLKGLSTKQQLLKREQWLTPFFEQANAAQYVYPNGKLGYYFAATQDQLQFVSASPILTGPGRNAAVQLQIIQQGDQYQLQYRQKFSADIQRGIYWSDEAWYTLVDKMKTIKFLYLAGIHLPSFGTVTEVSPSLRGYYRDTPAWVNTFDGFYEESLPHRVAIIITDHNDQTMRWEFMVTYNNEALAPMFGV